MTKAELLQRIEELTKRVEALESKTAPFTFIGGPPPSPLGRCPNEGMPCNCTGACQRPIGTDHFYIHRGRSHEGGGVVPLLPPVPPVWGVGGYGSGQP